MTDELLFKYVSDQADDAEKKLIQDWISESIDREKEISRIKNVWILSGLDREVDSILKQKEIEQIWVRIKTLNGEKTQKSIWLKWIKYAAVLLISITISGSLGYFLSNSTDFDAGYTEFIAPKGERSELVLPDGTKVKLNSGTTIKFSPSFIQGKRKVELEGEAYFQVTHDPSHPFVVKMSNLEVEVLGTVFNVSGYDEDQSIVTYLESGKVRVKIDDQDDIVLKPAEYLSFNKESGEITKKTSNDKYLTDWTKGILNIKGETIESLAKKLERWYDITIIFGDNEVKSHKYTGTIQTENINVVLEALKYTSSLNYNRDKKIVTIYSYN